MMTNSEQADSGTPKKLLRIAIGSTNPAKIRAVQQALQRILKHKKKEEDDNDDNDEITIQTIGFDVESGVSQQPMGDEETCLGAKNRAAAAYSAYRKAYNTVPHFALGLEGGLEQQHTTLPTTTTTSWQAGKHSSNTGENETQPQPQPQLYCMAWIAVYGKRSAFTVDLIASTAVKTYHGDRMPKFGLAKTACFAIPPGVATLVNDNGMELGNANDQVFGSTESRTGQGAVGLLTGGMIDRSAYYEHAILLAMTPWLRPDVYP